MHRINYILTALFVGLMSIQSHAVVTHGNGGEVYISAIDLGWNNKRVNVSLTKPVLVNEGTLSCGYGGSHIQADESQPNIDQILSVALAAYLSNKPVRVAVSEENCSLGGRYKMIAIGM